jgi:hypothetical protein
MSERKPRATTLPPPCFPALFVNMPPVTRRRHLKHTKPVLLMWRAWSPNKKHRPLRPEASQNPIHRAEDYPVRANQRVIHLEAAGREIAPPIVICAGDRLLRVRRGLVKANLRRSL